MRLCYLVALLISRLPEVALTAHLRRLRRRSGKDLEVAYTQRASFGGLSKAAL